MTYQGTTQDLFEPVRAAHQKYLPNVTCLEEGRYRVNEWDIPQTINQLSYLVHSDYRYYGKFPSVVAGQILEQIRPPSTDHYVLDNFCGSGTTLVEAKLRNIKSFGIDISWLATLASNVKTKTFDLLKVKRELSRLVMWFENNSHTFTCPTGSLVEKWFSPPTASALQAIQFYLKAMETSGIREFLLIAYIGIVRRVSRAYDGEVRPHINKEKRQRSVIAAFSKKVNDMINDHRDFQNFTNSDVMARCIVGNNLDLGDKFDDGKCYLVISHPPYLNSFNYAPVYSLEFYWAEPFENDYCNVPPSSYRSELKAHPANESVTEAYFGHLDKCYKETYRVQCKGSHLAIVIGDCTRNGNLIPVLDKTIRIVESIGYELVEINYRTTHYGLGKYAYKTRADYHGANAEKKDGILIFRK